MSSVGVTGARSSVSGKVESLLQEIKEVCLTVIAFFVGIRCDFIFDHTL